MHKNKWQDLSKLSEKVLEDEQYLGYQQIAGGLVEFPRDIHFTVAIKEL